MTNLFVGGFPRDMTEVDLAKLFMTFGDVSTIKIVRHHETRICKGYAFIEMRSADGAQRAIAALDNTPVGGRCYTVKEADTPLESVPKRNVRPEYISFKTLPAGPPRKQRPWIPRLFD